jgi:RNA processing factor Prp31
MDIKEVNIKLVSVLQSWDPLGYGCDAYETEIVDVVQAVHEFDEVNQLARKIQSIYEFSFEEIIPLSECKQLALTLLSIKHEASCEINGDGV